MAGKRTTLNKNNEPLIAALDVGNGEAVGVSNETPYPIGFEPLIAPMTRKHGQSKTDERPTFSLRVEKDSVLVFGIDDVYAHGQRDNLRRQSGMTRYTSGDYFNMIDALLLNLFGNQRGMPDRISPSLAINLPVVEFNKDATVDEIKETLMERGGKRDIADYDNCVLQIQLDPKRLAIMPESSGALMHWAFDDKTLERRAGSITSGSTIVCDVGYETTDLTLYEGMKYQRDRAFTVERSGMGNITRTISDGLIASGALRQSEESRIDRSLRPLASIKSGAEKWLTLPQGDFEISEVYDTAVSELSARIADRLHTLYPEGATRVLLAGGGTYHLKNALRNRLQYPVEIAPNPEHANVLGAFSTMRLQDKRRG